MRVRQSTQTRCCLQGSAGVGFGLRDFPLQVVFFYNAEVCVGSGWLREPHCLS
jgi:hypothetical protein